MRTSILALLLLAPCAALAEAPPAATAPAEAPPADAAQSAPAKGALLLAPKLGFFKTTTSLTGAFYAGLEVGYVTPLLDHKLAVALEGNWHLPRKSSAVTDPQLTVGGLAADGSYSLWEREVAAMLSVVYRAEGLFGDITPYGGLGPGYYLHRVTIASFGSTYVETEGSFGFQALVGAEYSAGPGAAFLEVHYHFTNVDFLSTGKVNVGGFLAASIGYRFRF